MTETISEVILTIKDDSTRSPDMPPAGQKRGGKTETLSLRLDPKTKFALDFVAKIRGQSITTVVERAIKEAASDVRTDDGQNVSWATFWDPSEGVRTLRLIANDEYPNTFEDDELREFTKAHWEFFYTSQSYEIPKRASVDVLWPDIETYLAMWAEKKHSDYWQAGSAMKAALSAADLATPVWPRGPAKPQPKKAYDINDDIPF